MKQILTSGTPGSAKGVGPRKAPFRHAFVSACLLLMLLVWTCHWRKSEQDVQVVRHHLSVGETVESKAVPVDGFERSQSPTAVYSVTLSEVSPSSTLALDCQWRDPRGAIMHENHYETRKITHSPWTTHCRNQFGIDSQPGRWSVTLSSGERVLCSKTFEVR